MGKQLSTFDSPLGWCALLMNEETALALSFGHRSAGAATQWLQRRHSDVPARKNAKLELANRIVAALEGEPDDFRDVAIDLEYLTSFGKRVIAVCRKIAWGQTRSYGELAKAAGYAGAARAVGQVMAGNRVPIVVPCHRVLASGNRIGGYSAPQGLSTKRRLLALESIVVAGG